MSGRFSYLGRWACVFCTGTRCCAVCRARDGHCFIVRGVGEVGRKAPMRGIILGGLDVV
jgi:hypothetical protein